MELTKVEIDERVAVLKRLRKLLEMQRDKFREYLNVLEHQENKIYSDDGQALKAHTQLEEQIVANISNLQKVIEPVQRMVTSFEIQGSFAEEENSVHTMQKELSDLKEKVLAQNKKNQQILKIHIEQLGASLDELKRRNPYRGRVSVYAESAGVASNLSIEV